MMEQTSRRGSVSVGALILIFIGVLFLLQNFGILPWSVWGFLWRFWPLLLIIWGLQAIFGRTPASRVAISVVAILLMLLVLAVTISAHHQPSRNWISQRVPFLSLDRFSGILEMITTSDTLAGSEYSGLDQRGLLAQFNFGNLTISDGSDSNFLTLLSKHPKDTVAPKISHRKVEKELQIGFISDDFNRSWIRSFKNSEYNLNLGQPNLPTNIYLEFDAGKAKLELNEVTVNKIGVIVNAGKAEINLAAPSIPTESIDLSVAVGSVAIRLPENVGLEVEHQIDLGRVEVDGELLSGDDIYTSQNYESAVVKLKLTIQVGAGSISIERQ